MGKLILCVVVLGVTMFSCSTPENEWRAAAEDPAYLHNSIKHITDVIVHDIFSPPVASRIYAYTSIAAYEAAIHGNEEFVSLAGQIHELTPAPQPEKDKVYCFQLASVQAALVVGKTLVFSEDKMEKYYDGVMKHYREVGIPSEVFNNSIEYGSAVAAHVLAWANKDNYKQSRSFPKYTVNDDPATWKPTPPAYMDGIEPHWNKIRTLVLDSPSQFTPPPPTKFSAEKESPFYNEAKEVQEIGNALTDEQKQIAMFWDCNPFMMNVKGHVMFATKKISPGGHWMNITHVACAKANKSFVESAEAYANVSIALMDGFISCWDEKYRSNLIRPETYINQYIDENWTPLLQTPPFPEYTSGHSVISNAAAVTLTKLFGDNFAFTDSTEIEFGLTARSFNSFMDASAEAAVSRLYGGIHYRLACDVGVTEGRELGKFIGEKIKTRKQNMTVSN
jgi:hypothetical protein